MRLGVKAMESTITEYDCLLGDRYGTHTVLQGIHSVRDGSHIIQFAYNGTGLDPARGASSHRDSPHPDSKVQAVAGEHGAFADLPTALSTWHAP
jgi:hypothetical protein